MSDKINKINVGGVEYDLPSGASVSVEDDTLVIENSGNSSGSSGSSGGGGTEIVYTLPQNPDISKMYKLISYKILLIAPDGVQGSDCIKLFENYGGKLSLMPVKELPEVPITSTDTDITIYIYNDSIYSYMNDMWVSDQNLIDLLFSSTTETTIPYSGCVDIANSEYTGNSIYLIKYEDIYVGSSKVESYKKLCDLNFERTSEEDTEFSVNHTLCIEGIRNFRAILKCINYDNLNRLYTYKLTRTIHAEGRTPAVEFIHIGGVFVGNNPEIEFTLFFSQVGSAEIRISSLFPKGAYTIELYGE